MYFAYLRREGLAALVDFKTTSRPRDYVTDASSRAGQGIYNSHPRCKPLNKTLVLGHLRIDPIRPRQYSSRKIRDLAEPSLLEEVNCLRAAHAGAAMRHNLPA